MKSILSLLLLLSSADAFTTTTSGNVRSAATTDSFSRTTIVLDASRNKDKIATRSKWAESRGYGVVAASDDSGDAGKSVPRLIIAGAPASGKGTQCEIIKEKCKCKRIGELMSET